MKKKITWLMVLIILIIGTIPSKNASALEPPQDSIWKYAKPQDFVYWINDKTKERENKNFVKAYKKEQGYLLAPKIKGAVLDNVCWGWGNVTVNYRFHNANIGWRMDVRPIKDCKKEKNFSQDIGTFVSDFGGIVFNQKEQETSIHPVTNDIYTNSWYYVKSKLTLGNHSIVDCVQYTEYEKNETTKVTYKSIRYYFFTSDMYVRVSCDFNNNIDGEKYLTQSMKNCTFQKYYTNPKLKILKKKNKVSKKNAIVYASIYNPTKKKYTYVDFYLYDKKAKKYKVHVRQKLVKKNSDSATIRFDVKKCIKNWKRRSISGKKYTLERKKKYKYKIQARIGGKRYQVVSSFKIK